MTAAYRFPASTSFANPAVAIARCPSDTFAGIRPGMFLGLLGLKFSEHLQRRYCSAVWCRICESGPLMYYWLMIPPGDPIVQRVIASFTCSIGTYISQGGEIYVIDRDQMGKFHAEGDAILQRLHMVGGGYGAMAYHDDHVFLRIRR